MRAVTWTAYGPPEVLQLSEVEKPAPKANEVLIRIRATTVTAGDCEMRAMRFPFWLGLPMRAWVGFTKPRGTTIPGTELAGDIEAMGADVLRFKPGDRVFGSTGMRLGTNAEYVCVAEKPDNGVLALLPAELSYENAVAAPFGALDALHFLRKGNVGNEQVVLINGAGGSIGTYAVQLAKQFGAEVVAVDSADKLEMLRSIGADRVIDYAREDFTQNGETYDVIFDVVGKSSFSRSLDSLTEGGVYLLANPRLSQMIRGPWVSRTGGKKIITQAAGKSTEDLEFIKELIEAGKLKTVIDRSYPLEQIVEAHRYVDTGCKQGNVIITI